MFFHGLEFDINFFISDVQKRQADKNKTLQDKEPHDLLNNIIEGVKYCVSDYPNGESECHVKIKGKSFSEKGSSRQDAREKCVKMILRSIFNINFDKPVEPHPVSSLSVQASTSSSDKFEDIIER